MKLLILLMLITSNCFGLEQNFSYKNFDEAIKGSSYIRFDMESTKVGILTTSFEGVVKNFNINYQKTGNIIKNTKVEFLIESMDTDNSSRNEKMHDTCFGKSQYQKITINLNTFKANSSGVVSAKIKIRGQWKTISVNVNSKITGKVITIGFNSKVGLKALGIPDPSIFIASVRDQVDLSGKVFLKVQ